MTVKALKIFLFVALALIAGESTASKNHLEIAFYDRDSTPLTLPRPPRPIFWDSRQKVTSGINVSYQRVIYESKRWFSIDLGGSAYNWCNLNDRVVGAALTAAFRLWLIKTDSFSLFFTFSFGPGFINKIHFSGREYGSKFLFQDYIDLGVKVGTQKQFTTGIRAYHYSNADIFKPNPGFDVPFALFFGMVF